MAIQLYLHVTTPALKVWVLIFLCTSSLINLQHFSVDECLPFLTFQYLKKIVSPKQMCECFSFLTFLFHAVFDFYSIFPHPLLTLRMLGRTGQYDDPIVAQGFFKLLQLSCPLLTIFVGTSCIFYYNCTQLFL